MQGTRHEAEATTGGADACRRLARLLGSGTVAAVSEGSASVDDLLGGRAEGLVVFPIDDAGPPEVAALLAEERARWASEIHDGVTQAVTAAFLELRRLASRPGLDADVVSSVDEALSALRASLFDLRGLLFDLTRPVVDAAPTAQRAREYVRGVSERWKLDVELDVEGDLEEVDEGTFTLAQQLIREALANVAKHADTGGARVSLRSDDGSIHVRIADDGRGFDPHGAATGPGHLGLELLRERVGEAGGTFSIETAPGSGTRVLAEVPTAPTAPEPTRPMPEAADAVATNKEKDR